MTAPVLGYERPLAPGTVRITRPAGGGVCVTIAPDTPRRVLVTYCVPVAMVAIAFALTTYTVVQMEAWRLGVPLLVVFVAAVSITLYRAARQGDQPIVFTADAESLHVRNPLDRPAERVVGVFEIDVFQLRRATLHTTTYELELCTRSLPGRPAEILSIISSPSVETLDYIGRTLVAAMNLPPPRGGATGWASVRGLLADAAPSAPSSANPA
jgi:hypothetical protein